MNTFEKMSPTHEALRRKVMNEAFLRNQHANRWQMIIRFAIREGIAGQEWIDAYKAVYPEYLANAQALEMTLANQ